MTLVPRTTARSCVFALCTTVTLVVGCGPPAAKVKYEQIQKGMSLDEVESILGPASEENKRRVSTISAFQPVDVVWGEGNYGLVIIFKNEKVAEKRLYTQ